MSEDWTFDITKVKQIELKEPIGYDSAAFSTDDSKARRQEVNEMKQNKAWNLVIGQGKGIFTNLISSFFIGTNVSIFTIGLYSYNLYNAINTLFNVNNAFKMYESPEYSLLQYKILYIIVSLISLCITGYKVNKMGFLPLSAADWAAFASNSVQGNEVTNLNIK